MEYTENKILPERALLVALDTGEYDAESSLDELWELAKSGGAEPVATLTQKRPAPETATCVGSGMVQEIRTFCEDNAIELIIFDRELTPTQIRNLEKETDVRVVDRTMLILDIFAQRAQKSRKLRHNRHRHLARRAHRGAQRLLGERVCTAG